ncbi:sugar phosphate isomerase/epimerase family protein [Gracilibacillus massiliensis]|uniref:sugar phosphate isomerase/epimerase family protein n=1 Tax=Gracilibacillus massiliensis TaxID=1564956 RepID=UPI00071DC445|nr:sugar phosphate isomerase/epimerase family protein [Gracilibacillus massiliensis]
MKLASRINSILPSVNGDILKALDKLANVEGITSVDLNYPEHFEQYSVKEIERKIKELNLEVNGLALRFRKHFLNGELGNSNQSISEDAKTLCLEAVDTCRALEGKVITVWLGFDGFDYPFQMNYEQTWQQVKEYLQQVADYAPELKISIEYKPYQERSYALIDSIGTTMLMVKEIDRKNVGVTVDYCHMLMKRENPAYGMNIAQVRGKLFGVHLNDGYGTHDDGLMLGTVSLMQTLEFLYYLKKEDYKQVIYFDTFPIREEPIAEITQNVKMIKQLDRLLDNVGMDYIQEVISQNNAIDVNELFLKCLKGEEVENLRV